MKRTLISLIAAAFALAAGASFAAQDPAHPTKTSQSKKSTKHSKSHASAKKSTKAPAAS